MCYNHSSPAYKHTSSPNILLLPIIKGIIKKLPRDFHQRIMKRTKKKIKKNKQSSKVQKYRELLTGATN